MITMCYGKQDHPNPPEIVAACHLQQDLIARLSLEKLKSEEGLVMKPFVPKKRSFAFPPVDRMGCAVLCSRCTSLQHIRVILQSAARQAS